MTVLVLADTHLRDGADLPEAIKRLNGSIDLIIHAGDFTGAGFLRKLERIAPVFGVRGNMDGGDVALPEKMEVDIERRKFGIVHGHKASGNILRFVSSVFERPDVIIFGHTHVRFLQLQNDQIILNPGSLTLPRDGSTGSYALIELSPGQTEIRTFSSNGEFLGEARLGKF